MSWNIELYIARLEITEERYSKSLNFEAVKDLLELRSYDKSYEDYIKPGLLYFTEDLNTLAKELAVEVICPKGHYIMGIYGGEIRKGEEKYAGLVLEDYKYNGTNFEFKLYDTWDIFVTSIDLLRKFGIMIYKMVYVGEINPFKLKKYLNIILSYNDEESLKQFLKKTLDLNLRDISIDTFNKVSSLINELKQPNNITPLNMDKYYVVYRCDGVFTAFAFKPMENNIIIESHVSYIMCNSEAIAYYYTAILNYLAYKVVEYNRSFNRHQFARPLFSIYLAGLSWNGMDNETRERIIELSKLIHKKAPDKEYPNQRVALKNIASLQEFKELVKILDSKVDKEKLEEALNLVSGKGSEPESD
jgi:uncharacterized CHY-type Zn-finger protein